MQTMVDQIQKTLNANAKPRPKQAGDAADTQLWDYAYAPPI